MGECWGQGRRMRWLHPPLAPHPPQGIVGPQAQQKEEGEARQQPEDPE